MFLHMTEVSKDLSPLALYGHALRYCDHSMQSEDWDVPAVHNNIITTKTVIFRDLKHLLPDDSVKTHFL
jgi:hypothetical protein